MAAAALLMEELRAEQLTLVKADADIVQGQARLEQQQARLAQLRESGHDTVQAEHLLLLFEQILDQWELHRVLIRQRIIHLQAQIAPALGPFD
jgi:hypothetical protein